MTILVFGATGATGQHFVRLLLDDNRQVRAVVRNRAKLEVLLAALPKKGDAGSSGQLEVIEREILSISPQEMIELVKGCDTVCSFLGHELSFSGLFGRATHYLCRDVLIKVCDAIVALKPKEKVKVSIMNTVGALNKDLDEAKNIGSMHSMMLSILRNCIKPHDDNEQANETMRQLGKDHPYIDWVCVRPDGLLDARAVSNVAAYESPLSNPLSNPGQIGRINVAAFMARLVTSDTLWATWRHRMPVLYDADKLPSGVTGDSSKVVQLV